MDFINISQTTVPYNTIELIPFLEGIYPDVFEFDALMVGSPEYWKKAGALELIKMLKSRIDYNSFPITK